MSLFRGYCEHLRRLADQAAHLGTLDWLLSSDPKARRTGRTQLMALTFVRHAALSPGSWVEVWDHHDHSRAGEEHMLRTVEGMFPGGLESGRGAIMSHEGWPRDHRNILTPDALRKALLEDVKTAARAAFDLGVPPEEVEESLKDALVQCVMEA